MGTVFFTALATFTGTARSGPTAAVFELQETIPREAANNSTSPAKDFRVFPADEIFMVFCASRYARLPPTASIPRARERPVYNFIGEVPPVLFRRFGPGKASAKS